jgi:hypothetical protein
MKTYPMMVVGAGPEGSDLVRKSTTRLRAPMRSPLHFKLPSLPGTSISP